MSEDLKSISVSELTSQIRNILEGEFVNVCVNGEISNFKHHYSGHMYLTLKDEQAEIKAVMFKGFNQYLRFKPEDGMKVTAVGRITVYEQRGQYQLVLKQMEPSGIGSLYLAFEALKKQLSDEGLFDSDRKLNLPKYPKTVGVITSKTGAAVQDIFQVLERRAPFIEIILRSAQVQGEGAAQDIANAVNEFNQFKNIDVIILGRGGGSLEDLWPFNEEILARAISSSKIPIISAVGHETDFSISDMVADMRAPTPSAAAEMVSLSSTELTELLLSYRKRFDILISSYIERHWQKVDDIYNRHSKQKPQNIIEMQNLELQKIAKRFIHSMVNFLEFKELEFAPIYEKLIAFSPQAILNRGYSLAFKTDDGTLIRSPQDIKNDSEFELLTAKGSFAAKKIKNIKDQRIK